MDGEVSRERRIDMTDLYGILGFPLGHSLSPAMQIAAFRAAGIDAHYIPIAVAPDRIRRSLSGLKTSGIRGFNVTVPYKETVLPFIDRLSSEARAAGAVNTIVLSRRDGRWAGHNTDLYGFKMLLARARIRIAGKCALVLGAGGAARAVLAAILPEISSVALLNRTLSRARRLRLAFPPRLRKKILLLNPQSSAVPVRPNILINATSVGLRPGDRLRLPGGIWSQAMAAVDLVYNPPLTHFLRQARSHGCRIANGTDMLIFQGAGSYSLWTGRRAPVDVMRRAIRKALAVGGTSLSLPSRA